MDDKVRIRHKPGELIQWESVDRRITWNPDDDRFYVEVTDDRWPDEWFTVGSFRELRNASYYVKRLNPRLERDEGEIETRYAITVQKGGWKYFAFETDSYAKAIQVLEAKRRDYKPFGNKYRVFLWQEVAA